MGAAGNAPANRSQEVVARRPGGGPRRPGRGQPMGSQAAVAPPGSLPVFGWSCGRRGRRPPVRAAGPCLWEAPGRSAAPFRQPYAGCRIFNFSMGEEGGLWGRCGRDGWEDCAARDGKKL